jgi:hypothetical protein
MRGWIQWKNVTAEINLLLLDYWNCAMFLVT